MSKNAPISSQNLNPLTTLLLIILRTFCSLSTTSELVLVGFASFFDDLTVVKLMFVFVSWRKKLTKREPKHSSDSFFAHTTDMWKKIKKKSCKGFFGKIESYKLCFVWGYLFPFEVYCVTNQNYKLIFYCCGSLSRRATRFLLFSSLFSVRACAHSLSSNTPLKSALLSHSDL